MSNESLAKHLHNWRAKNKDFSGGSCGIHDNKVCNVDLNYGQFDLCGDELELSYDEACSLHKKLAKWLLQVKHPGLDV